MNKHLYRMIFSKTQQRLVVVSEIATREGKAKGEGGRERSFADHTIFSTAGWQLQPLTLGLFCALGFLFVSTSAVADQLQIRADQTAPKNQQAIVLSTANGIPQVNIQSPNDKGLSHNKYQQFDVDTQGAILNNSRTNVQTEQGGWVQGNPYLARGEAKVILNEVNSSNPSQLKGYVEVAGKRAEVIIANPSGIHCEGCGTINASRSTFTTGQVEIENGQIKGYQVEQGKVTVSGRGMDTSRADYTDIIARETQANAGIWAKELKVTTGKNKVSADNQSVQVIHRSQQTDNPTDTQVRYAVDVSELGGMYAGKIHLVGTEDGLGVRNAGHIGATQGDVQIDSQGQIVNSGFVGAKNEVKASAKQQLHNTGTVYALQGNVQLTSQTQGINQHGSVIAKGGAQGKGQVKLTAKQAIEQRGETLAESHIDYRAEKIQAEKSSTLAAGVKFNQTDKGEQKALEAQSDSGKNVTLTANQSAVAQGKNLASNQFTVQAKQIDMAHSQTSANRLVVNATQGKIVADDSIIQTQKAATFSTPTALSTLRANLNAEHIHITADRADNSGGTWMQRSGDRLNLTLNGGLTNSRGQIRSGGDISLSTTVLNNQQGLLDAGGNLTLDTQQGKLTNQDGILSAVSTLTIDSGELDNQGGLMQSGASAVINTHRQRLDNRNTLTTARNKGIISLGGLSLNAGKVDNQQGYIASQGAQQLNLSGDLNNRQGEIRSLTHAELNAVNWENSQGSVSSNGKLNVTLIGDLSGEQSHISARQDLKLNADNITQHKQSLLHSDQQVNINANQLNSTANSEISGEQLDIQLQGSLDNSHSRLLANQTLEIVSTTLTNLHGTIAALQGNASIDTQKHQFNNQSGIIQAKHDLSLKTGGLDNHQGLIQSGENTQINTHGRLLDNSETATADNSKGIVSLGELKIETADLLNQNGFIGSIKQQTIQADKLNNTQGVIRSDSGQTIELADDFNNTAGNILAAQDLSITGHALNNTSGLIRSRQNLQIDTQQNTLINENTLDEKRDKGIIALGTLTLESAVLSNQQGYIASKNDQTITATRLNNLQGVLQTNEDLTLTALNGVDNIGGRIMAEQVLTLQSGLLDNQQGLIQGTRKLSLNTHGQRLNNSSTLSDNLTQGIITLGELSIEAAELINKQGVLMSGGNQTITAQTLNNHSGVISANAQLTAKIVGDLINTEGQLISSDKNHLTVGTLNNTQGIIGSQQGGATLTVVGSVNNHQGKVMASKEVNITSEQLDNMQGSIHSLTDITLDTQVHKLNNKQGNIVAGQGTTILSGQLTNQQGLISGQSAVHINTQGEILDNSNTKNGGIISNGDITLQNITELTNQQGNLSAGNLLHVSAQSIDNQKSGSLFSEKQLVLNSDSLDNRAGSVTALQSAVITASSSVNNMKVSDTGSVIQAGETLQLTTPALDNNQTKANADKPTQGLIAANIQLNGDHLNNQSGGIYTTTALAANIRDEINNQNGEIFSLGSLNLQGLNLRLDNRNGKIESRQLLNLDLLRFVNEGSIKTQGNANIKLQQDLILNQAFQVDGTLSLTTQGNFYNRTQLVTGNGLRIKANAIENPFNSELSSDNTYIETNRLTNRGLVDGISNVIKTGELNNLGTGRIYGDHLAIQANHLRNDQETANGETKSATIAARERLDLAVGTLTNRDHALIFSVGDLAIGGQLDENNRATGKASFIDNGSATIEALGNGVINTARLWNHDLHLKLGEKHDYANYFDYSPEGSAEIYHGRTERDGHLDWNNNNRRDRNAYFRFDDKNKPAVGSPTWYQWEYTRHTTTQTIEHQDPAKLLIGGHLSLSGDNLVNESSGLLVGKSLLLDDQQFINNTTQADLVSRGSILKNIDQIGIITRQDNGESSTLVSKRKRKKLKKVWAHHTENQERFTRDLPIESFNFNLVDNSIGNLQRVQANSSNQTITPATEHQHTGLAAVNIGLSAKTVRSATANNDTTLNALMPVQASDINSTGNQGNIASWQSTPVITTVSANSLGERVDISIKTYSPNIALPQASLYKINPATDSHVLVETDPQFTNRRQWLSSDYMFNALRYDHNNMHKRLGDGFYEQRLINEQVNQLTGRRFLGNYQSDYEQYKALMDSGVKYANQFGLIPGVALSEAQMKELTTDMVWLVNREVQLADGTTAAVLAPQVYIVARDTDVTTRGAVISANEIIANISGDMENSGTISGRNLTALSANNIRNLGGTLQSNQLLLNAKNELANLGGSWTAADKLLATAKNLRIESTLSETTDTGEFYKKGLNQLAKVQLKNSNGALIFRSQEDITIKGANIDVAGSADLLAGNQLHLGTLTTENKEQYNFDSDNYYRLQQTQEIGNQLNFGGNARLAGQDGVTVRGNAIHAEGELRLESQGDIHIDVARQTEQLASASKTSSRGLLSKTTEIRRHNHDYDLAVGSQIDAKTLVIATQQGDVNIVGSDVVGEDRTLIQAKNISIVEAENRVNEENVSQTKKSGLMKGGSFGFSIGSRQTTLESDNSKYYARGSQVGSLSGDTLMLADNAYLQRGSAVTSVGGDSIVYAKSADVVATDDKYESNQKYTFEQKGLTIAVKVPALQAIQAAQSAVKSVKNVGDSKNSRINAMGAANAAWNSLKAAEGLQQLGEGLANGDMSAVQNVSVSITYGEQKNITQSHTQGTTASGSQLRAGGKAMVVTTGDKENSHINIKGSDVAGADGTLLKTAGKLNIEAAEQNHQERSKNSSQGFNAGVAVSYGSGGLAFGVTAGGNLGRGYGNGDDRTWVNSHVGMQDSHTTLISGDTAIVGGVVKGKGVTLETDNLVIKSLQDTMKYKGKQQHASGQITVGYGVSGEASYNQSKMNADYASVREQSGIISGDDGYQIKVNEHTDLTGGLITSSEQAEAQGNNRFSTGTLDYRDIQNYANYDGNTMGVSGGFNMGGGDAPKELGGVKLAEQGSNHAVVDGDPNSGKGKLETSINGVGFGSDSSRANGVTQSGINTNRMEITDSAGQQTLTGKTSEQALAEIKTSITTNTAEQHSGSVANTFDKDAVQKELDIQRSTTEAFGRNAAQGVALTAESLGKIKAYELAEGVKLQTEQRLKQEAEPSKRAELERTLAQAEAYLEQNKQDYDLWKEGGAARTALHMAAGGILTGNVSGALASGATSLAAPHLNEFSQELGDVGNAVLNIGAGMAIGAATGGGISAVSAGGNTDWHNRQLHPNEMNWIKANAARFAEEQGISQAEAEQRLIERAAQRVDYAWAKKINTQDVAADSFLNSASAGVHDNDVPYPITSNNRLFSATADEYFSMGLGSKAASEYDKANNRYLTDKLQPRIQNNLVISAGKDAVESATGTGLALLNDPLTVLDSVGRSTVYGTMNCLKDGGCIKSAWNTFDNSSGDLLETHYNVSDVNYLYGSDVSHESKLIPLVRGGSIVVGAVPVGKIGSSTLKGISEFKKELPVVGKTTGYENQITRISNPHSPYLEVDRYGNEVYYRSLSSNDYEIFLNTGVIPPSNETFISPLAKYSENYNGVLLRITTKPGTSKSLQEIGVAGNSSTKRYIFPEMPRAEKGWAENNKAMFKLEGTNLTDLNDGKGIINTGLGKSEALWKFNENIIEVKKIDKE